MKRTRAQQPKLEDPQQDPANPKPAQRRAKQPRQPKAGANAAKKPAAAAAAAARVVAAANAAASSAAAEMAPTVPDACGVAGEGEAEAEAEAEAGPAHAVDWDLDAGLNAAAAWWTWGVDEEKLLGWFPFVEEDFRYAGGRAGDAEVAAFDHDIWSIW
ncbi:hypothetical protein BS78_03G077900 [Paspalum vaginatum]|nr:hypothetical protein BS78_03G077900 [Paspalum vaginatum]